MLLRKSLHALARVGLLLIFVLVSPHTKANNTIGEFEVKSEDGQIETALLLSTELSGKIDGMLANISVKQTFQNDSDDWINGRYVFPLPDGAAVDSLRIHVGERVINGVIKEKGEAKKVFEQAKREGKKAGLLEQHRANLFSISVANIAPHEQVETHITFIDKVIYDSGVFTLRLPTTLTPRYVPGTELNLSKELQAQLETELSVNKPVQLGSTGWASNTARVPDASEISPPQAHSIRPFNSHRFSLGLSLNAGLAIQQIESTSHQILANPIDSNQFEIQLANGQELMDSDLLLKWQAVPGARPEAAMFQQKFGESYYSMLMLVPPSLNASLSIPRDVTFIIDSSGSMAGEPMTQAKQSLHEGLAYLSSSDKFNIVDFDSSFRPLYQQSQPVTPEALKNAHAMIRQLDAEGGTEMMGALSFALSAHSDPSYLKQIVFITDGAIGNETELFRLIKNNLQHARLFTVGIGSAPNSYFMNKAAKFGRGSNTYISNTNQVSAKMAELFSKITKPLLRDIKIDWPTTGEQFPKRIPDLYAGEPITVVVKSDQAIDSVNIQGSMLNTPWNQSMNMSSSPTKANNLDAVWARDKVAHIMDKFATGEMSKEQARKPIIALGIDHHIVTKFTSFVAVEKKPSKPTGINAKNKHLANLMPSGTTMPAPNTATPSSLLKILGLLLIVLALRFRRITQSGNRQQEYSLCTA